MSGGRTAKTILPDYIDREYLAWREQHGVCESDALRIAVLRLIKKPPTKHEREAAKVAQGNPDIRKAVEASLRKRAERKS